MISIIIAVGTEKNIQQYQQILESIKGQGIENERIWIGGSTVIEEWLKNQGETHIQAPDLNRAARMNIGIKQARFDYYVLNHPRSVLQNGALRELAELIRTKQAGEAFWGCFTHKFMGKMTPLKRFTSWYSNRIRCGINKVVYLEHCFYLSKKMYQEIKILPEEDIFEDTLLSYGMRKVTAPKRLDSISLTSDVRFQKKGFARQALLNQYVKLLFLLGYSSEKINEVYERGLWLN